MNNLPIIKSLHKAFPEMTVEDLIKILEIVDNRNFNLDKFMYNYENTTNTKFPTFIGNSNSYTRDVYC